MVAVHAGAHHGPEPRAFRVFRVHYSTGLRVFVVGQKRVLAATEASRSGGGGRGCGALSDIELSVKGTLS